MENLLHNYFDNSDDENDSSKSQNNKKNKGLLSESSDEIDDLYKGSPQDEEKDYGEE